MYVWYILYMISYGYVTSMYMQYRQLLPEPKKYPKITYCGDVKTLCDSTLYY